MVDVASRATMDSATQHRRAPSTAEPVQPTSVSGKKPALSTIVTRVAPWMAGWSIEHRVLAGFGLVFAGIVVISVVSYRNTSVLIKNSRLDTRSHELVQLLGSIGEALDDAERGHRRYLVTGDEAYLKGHTTILEQMPDYSRYLQGLTEGSCHFGARKARV
jgi:CHASE3 domain-containing protein